MRTSSGPRRNRGTYLAAVGLIAVLGGCQAGAPENSPGSSSAANGDKTLVITSPGGSYGVAMNAAYFQPFENETGIKVELVEGGEDAVAGARAQVESGNVLWDLVLCAPPVIAANQDIYEEVPSDVTSADVVYEMPGHERGTLNDVESFPLIVHSTTTFPNGGPTDAAGFFDTETYPGPRGIPDIGLETAYLLPALALLADGVPSDELLPLDLDRAYQKLDQLRPDVRVIWTTFTQSQDIIRSGEVVVNLMSDGRALQLINAGVPVSVSFKDGFRGSAAWCVLKGAPHKDDALAFLRYIHSHPEQQGIFTSLTYYGPPTAAGVEAAKAIGVEDFASLHSDELIPDTAESIAYIQENSDELLNRWNAWVNQ